MSEKQILEELKAENEAMKKQLVYFADLATENEVLKAENEALKLQAEKGSKIAKIVPGTYTSKKHKKTIQFVAGALKVRYNYELLDSAEVIKNKNGEFTDLLDHLIEIGAGNIQEITE